MKNATKNLIIIKKKDFFVWLLLCLVLICFSSQPLYAGCSFTLGWEDWAPYQFQKADKMPGGLDIDLISTVMKYAKCDLSYIKLPWKKHLVDLEHGTVDLAPGASKSADREVYAYFSDAYRKEQVVLFVRKGESEKYPFKSIADIKNYDFHLGVSRGYYYGETYAALLKDKDFKRHIQEVANDRNNFLKFSNHRIDGFLADPFSAIPRLKKEKLLEKIERHPVKVYSADIFVMFSKKSTTLEDVAKFNQSLKKLKENGVHQSIIDKYLK